jgi:serine/threonine protein kinase
MLAGSPPFTADTMPEIVAKILQSPLPSLRAVRPDAPAAIEQVIVRCTAKDPTARFGDVAELARALVAFAPDTARSADRATRILGRSAEPPSGKPATDAVPPSPSPDGGAQSEVRSHAAWGNTRAAGVPRRNVAPYVLASVLGVIAIAGGFAVFAGRGPPSASAPASASSLPADPLPPAVSVPASVVLSPPPTESAAASAAPSVEPLAAKPAVAKPPHVLPKPVPSTTVASAAPQAPTPPPVPTDPLHMGIK